jgi:hypothetical protein
MAQAVSRRPFTAEVRDNPRGICSGKCGTETSFPQRSSGVSMSALFHRALHSLMSSGG